MKYTVVWRPFAERTLTNLWIDSKDRQAITNAADTMDTLLRNDPLSVGESRDDGVRLLYVAPLAVYYDVFPQDQSVSKVRDSSTPSVQ